MDPTTSWMTDEERREWIRTLSQQVRERLGTLPWSTDATEISEPPVYGYPTDQDDDVEVVVDLLVDEWLGDGGDAA